jgi:general secretion pathway protein M
MMVGSFTLPEGRQGQMLALALTFVAVAVIWAATVAPLIGLYESQADTLAQQRAMAARMVALSQEIPALRHAVATAGLQSADDQLLLPGDTDAIAGANLQSALQNLATQAGTSLDSAQLLPVQSAGNLQCIGMQVSVTASWPVLIALLQAIGTAQPRMIVGDFRVSPASQGNAGQDPPMQATFSVSGFRAGAP